MSTAGPKLLARLVDEHGAALVLYARQLCATPEDVVQDAFLQLVRQPEVPENVVGWLYRVARNGAISASRSQARRTCHESSAAGAREPWFDDRGADRLDAATVSESLASPGTVPIFAKRKWDCPLPGGTMNPRPPKTCRQALNPWRRSCPHWSHGATG